MSGGTLTFVAILAALAVILAALSVAPAQLAARALLRQTVGGPGARARTPALLMGLGVGAGAAAVLAGVSLGAEAALVVAVLTLLALLATIDVAWRWLPLEWCALIAVIGAAEAVLNDTYAPALLGALVGGGLLLTLRLSYLMLRNVEALGLGDVWLAAAVGSLVGPFHIIWVLGTAAVVGLLLHFVAPRVSGSERGVAFGAHICVVTPFFLGL
ncbi:MAG: prepilin peptidase [Paracoccaceae bacterium]